MMLEGTMGSHPPGASLSRMWQMCFQAQEKPMKPCALWQELSANTAQAEPPSAPLHPRQSIKIGRAGLPCRDSSSLSTRNVEPAA
jgi:hypothetical protein